MRFGLHLSMLVLFGAQSQSLFKGIITTRVMRTTRTLICKDSKHGKHTV